MLIATILMAALLLGATVTISNFETGYYEATRVDEQYRYVGEELAKFEDKIDFNKYNRNQSLRMIELSDYAYNNTKYTSSCLDVEISKANQVHRYEC